jgi:hypothetical protein
LADKPNISDKEAACQSVEVLVWAYVLLPEVKIKKKPR